MFFFLPDFLLMKYENFKVRHLVVYAHFRIKYICPFFYLIHPLYKFVYMYSIQTLAALCTVYLVVFVELCLFLGSCMFFVNEEIAN